MQRLIIILILLPFSARVYSQRSAFINIYEESSYPYDGFTKTAQKQYTWTFNGKIIKYKTGKYDIKINKSDQFDTIQFQNIYKRTDFIRLDGHATYDTSTVTILCKFRENHNYKLGQIFPGHFEIYSLDTFESKKSFVFKLVNKKDNDTLYLSASYPEHKILSDTILAISTINEKMEQSFLEHIEFSKSKRVYVFDGPGTSRNNIFELYYNYLHAENLEIEYDFMTKKYKLKLLN